jgi:hypothetical protein
MAIASKLAKESYILISSGMVESTVPSVLNLVILALPMASGNPTIIFPSGCIAKDWTGLISQLLKLESLVPLVLSLIILLVASKLYIVNHPPTIIFPSLWIARDLT